MRRPSRLLCRLAAVLLAFVVAGHLGAAPAAAATPGEAEASFLSLLNRARTSAGLPALQDDGALAGTSRSWSSSMAGRDQLSHDPGLQAAVERVEPDWQTIAENVGVGYDVQQLHDAFMASTAHRTNMMSGRFNRVGIGVVVAGTKIWVTVRFLQGPALAAASAPAPSGVRTVLTGDFDGDGHDDVLTYGPGAEADELWFGQPGRTMRKGSISVDGHYQPVAGDFDGDGRTDVLWYAPGSAPDALWRWDGAGWTATPQTINGRYTARAGDFDGDGVDDVLWYAPGPGTDFRWYGSRTGSFTSTQARVDGTYLPVVGDFDGDGGDDVFWYARGSAGDAVWYSTGQRGAHRSVAATAGGSHTPFAGDFDGNGADDVFFYTPGSGADSTWFNSAGAAFGGRRVSRSVNGTYVAGAADFDGDGADDTLWFSPSGASGDPIWWGAPSATYSAASLRAG